LATDKSPEFLKCVTEEYGFEIKLPPGWIAKIDDYFKSPVFISAETNKTAEENCKPGGRCNPEKRHNKRMAKGFPHYSGK
jgi:hypothetical protein